MNELCRAAKKIAQWKCGHVLHIVFATQKNHGIGSEGAEISDDEIAADRSFGNFYRSIRPFSDLIADKV